MAQAPDPSKKEGPSTYMVQDRSNQEELLRLDGQNRLLNTAMHGVLSEQTDPTRFHAVLDVGCGTGGWLIHTAQAYPTIEQLWGVDISARMIEYGCTQAEAAQVNDRVFFKVGDALRMLEFPTHSFDLVNQRLGMSFLRTWDWPNLLQEYQRVCKPEGVIRISEGTLLLQSTSPALVRLSALSQDAFYHSGHLFTNSPDGVMAHVAEQMTQYGILDVQTQQYTFAYEANSQEARAFAEDMQRLFRTIVPFLRKWTNFPHDYDDIYLQMVQETNGSDFQATHAILTAWGTA